MDKEELIRFLKRWNDRFPLDYLYRKRHNIVFNSPQHRALNPLDIAMDFLESSMFDSMKEELQERRVAKEKLLKTENWLLSEEESEVRDDELFDNLNIGQLNNKANIE